VSDVLGKAMRRGRKGHQPPRDTVIYPRLDQLGRPRDAKERPAYKPIARNLRYFSRTPYARRAINRIKGSVCQLDWEIVPLPGTDWTPELRRQAEVATYCFENPNEDDSFRTLCEIVVEDVQCGAGAIELQLSGDKNRPLWMWPVDGLSIQIFPGWNGEADKARYLQTVGYGGLGNLASDGILLRNDELIYLRPNPNSMDPFGVGPLEVAFMSVARQLGVTELAGNIASNQRPSVMLWFKGAEDRYLNAFRSYWRNEVEGMGQTPIIGSEDASAIRLHPDGDKGLFLEWQRFLIHEIATAFDLSPSSLGQDAGVNRSTAEVMEDAEWTNTIRPNARNFSAYLTREALHRKLGFHQLHHRFIGMDRDDELATAQIFDIYYKANAILPNEQRDKLGWPKSDNPWAEKSFVETQMALAAEAPTAAAAPDKGPKPVKSDKTHKPGGKHRSGPGNPKSSGRQT
jgi:hypothetical protein